MMTCSAPADCAEIERRHATGNGLLTRRRREPREPALGRGRPRHPHRQPDGRREGCEPRLPRVLRERLQRHAGARPLLLGGHPRVDRGAARDPPGRPAARPPRRDLPVHARRDVRHRARPHRLRRPDRHDEGTARDLRDLLELRRGGPPLRAGAGRHARGAAEARPAVRPDRPRAPLRTPPVRDRRALRSRPDAGGDVQAAQRLRARRARRALARVRRGRRVRRRRRAERDGRPCARRGDRARRRRSARRTTSPTATWSCSGPETSASSTSWRSRGASRSRRSRSAIRGSCRRCASIPHVGWLLVRSAEHGAGRRSAATGTRYLSDDRVEGEDPLAPFSPTAHLHLRRTDGFEHVADIMVGSFYDPELDEGCAFEELISFHGGLGGLADPSVHPLPRRPAGARRAAHRCRGRPRPAQGLAHDAERPDRRLDERIPCTRLSPVHAGDAGDATAGTTSVRRTTRTESHHDDRRARGPPRPDQVKGRAPHRRRARGARPGLARGGAPLRPCRPRPRPRSPGSDRPARGPGRVAGARAGADPLRTHARLAVHLLPWRGADHGERPRRHAHERPARPALRGRPPLELRRLREPRAAGRLRHQRLRRDPARAVRVGPQAAGGEPRGRRPGPGLRGRRPRCDRPRLRQELSLRDGRFRGADATSRPGTRGSTSRTCSPATGPPSRARS